MNLKLLILLCIFLFFVIGIVVFFRRKRIPINIGIFGSDIKNMTCNKTYKY